MKHAMVLTLTLTLLWGTGTATPVVAEGADSGEQAIVEAVAAFVERAELAGAVMLVANADEVVCHTSVGFADREKGAAMPPDALFWIASQSKPTRLRP